MDLGSTSPRSDMISAEKYEAVDAFIDVHIVRNTLSYHFSGATKTSRVSIVLCSVI